MLGQMIYTNGRLVFPDRVADGLSLRVTGGKIATIAEKITPEHGEEVVDLNGNFLAPGFIDLHVHGALGRDTMEGTPEAFRAICDYHASGGTTSLCLTIVTAPLDEIVRVVRAIETAMPEIPQLRGAHVEGPFISREKRGAQCAEFIVEPTAKRVNHLLENSTAIKRLTLAPELPGALELISRLTKSEIAASGGHSNAWDEEARAAFDRGMRQVTHTFNCMSSMHRRDGERVAGLLEFALSEPAIFCELIADGHHVSTTLMRMAYQAKGAAGICLVTDATAGAGLPNESHFQLGGAECVVHDGACWLADGSALAGSAARMIDLVRQMVAQVGAPVHEAIRMATETPARAMGWKNKGLLAEGKDADLVVLSPELEVLTFAIGKGARAIPSSAPRASDL
ncbi:MAG TPA: N-acetylglucosamine-6-phosphate deacetylase [Chthoniobacterales bacterium]|nr:N-acetylglucosamine-6-phosphate deacetylase [Chthoniobacterales bacterium]